MPQWAGSSWYFLRYIDPDNNEAFAGQEALKYWLPVDWYNGGMEHTTLHLLYSRFWHKFLYDEGLVPTLVHPCFKFLTVVFTVNQTVLQFKHAVEETSAAAHALLRPGCTQIKCPDKHLVGAQGIRAKFRHNLVRVHNIPARFAHLLAVLTENHSVRSALFVRLIRRHKQVTKGEFSTLILLLSPVAPHMCEELWQTIGNAGRVYAQAWPEYDEAKTIEDEVEIAVQVGGKVKALVKVGMEDTP